MLSDVSKENGNSILIVSRSDQPIYPYSGRYGEFMWKVEADLVSAFS